MNLKQLEYFVACAENKNITVTAQKLHMAQPPLSRQLSLLEDELGVQLMIRSNKGIELTDAGKILFDKSKDIMKNIDDMTEIVKETNTGIRGSVNIGTIYSCLPVFSYKIHYMNQNYPNIKFNIVHRDPHSLLQLLEKGEIDVLFLRTPTCQTGGFSSHILQEDIFTLVVNKNLDPCPESTEIEIAQLKDIPLCMLRTGKYWGYNEILISACKKSGFEPNIICECYDTSIAMMMVIMGIGFSYQPMDIVLALNNPDIYPKIINGFEIKTFPLLIWNDKKYLPRAVRLFLSLFDVKTAQNQFS